MNEHQTIKLRAAAIIKASIRKAYDIAEKEATLFAVNLVEKLDKEKLLK